MGLFKTMKKGLSSGFSPKRWVGLEHVKANGKIVADLAKDLVEDKSKSSALKEKYQASWDSMTPKEFAARKRFAVVFMVVYVLVGISLIGYAWYLWFSRSLILPGCISFAMALLVFTYSLRELMVYAQIRLQRKHLKLRDLFTYLIKGFPK